jgi:branched-chain amino acid transport system substrate-binding protein
MKLRSTVVVCAVAGLGLAACSSSSGNTGAGATSSAGSTGTMAPSAPPPASSAAATSTLKVGAAISLTGASANEGKLTQDGYKFCVDAINAKGGVPVGGTNYKLDVSYQDDDSDPATSAQIVDTYNDQGVKFILSSYGSATTAAEAPVVERNGQLMVDSMGADNTIFTNGYKRTFAILAPASQYEASLVDSIMDDANPAPKTVVFLSADDGFSKSVTQYGEAEAKAKGLNVLDTEYFKAQSTDLTAAVTKIRGLHPDLILESGHLVEGVALMQAAKQLGAMPAGGIGETVAPPDPQFPKTLGTLANGVLGSSQWAVTQQGSEPWFGSAQDFNTNFNKEFGFYPDYHSAGGAAACLTLVDALQKAGTTDPDKVRDAMAALDLTTFWGPIKFDTTGVNTAKKMIVMQVQNGTAVAVWPSDAKQADMTWPAVTK